MEIDQWNLKQCPILSVSNTMKNIAVEVQYCRQKEKLVYPDELRSITVSTIGLKECQEIVIHKIPNHIQITAKDICTGELNGIKGSCHGDSGGPLVIDGKLAGVFSFTHSKNSFSNRDNPDIFVNVAHPLHKFWINTYLQQFSGLVHD
ncbi:trypsin-3-like [Belonocnema kinseyi]|uniref:trypsin-3-like n=1 Tax=Belonocnema kinseyi TaxID=2817044 RepID=UPI00143D7F62|nr:trypsin-3-like [Belonocnema kinseyi]